MIVYAMKAPELVKAIGSRKFWSLSMYFDQYEIDFERGVIFGIGGQSNPKYSLQDFSFNEAEDFQKLIEEFGEDVKKYEVKAANWMPVFE